jgi:hypothetical protein
MNSHRLRDDENVIDEINDNDEKVELVDKKQSRSDQADLSPDFERQDLANDFAVAPLADQYPLAQLAEFKADHYLANYLNLAMFQSAELPLLTDKETTQLKEILRLGSQNDSLVKMLKKLNHARLVDTLSQNKKKATVGFVSGLTALGALGSLGYKTISSFLKRNDAKEEVSNYINILAASCSEYLFYPKCDTANDCQRTYNPLACKISYGMNKTSEYTQAVAKLCTTTCSNLISANAKATDNEKDYYITFAVLIIAGCFTWSMGKFLKKYYDSSNEKTVKEILGDSAGQLDSLMTELSLQNQAISADSNVLAVMETLVNARIKFMGLLDDKIFAARNLRHYGFFQPSACDFIDNTEKYLAERQERINKAQEDRPEAALLSIHNLGG